MKTNAIPAIIMLVAGFIDCVLSIFERLSLFDFLKRLLVVLIIFYILGCVVKIIIDMNFAPAEEPDKEESEDDESELDEDAEADDDELENIEAGEDDE